MKTQINPDKKCRGSAMISVAILAMVVGGALATYLLMVSGESTFVARSETWNNAMVIAEGGMEEGLACVNKNVGQAGSLLNWTNVSDGWDTSDETAYKALTWTYQGVTTNWQSTSGVIYHIRRYLDSTNGYYDVYINNSSNSTNGPEILSIGTADWTTLASSDSTNVSVKINSPATRKIYLQTSANAQSGDNGLVANSLTFHGNNVTIDSFDSTSSSHSIWNTHLWFHGANYGTWSNTLSYSDSSLPSRTANVHVAAETNNISVGNANIYGYINTSPGGTESVGAQGSVGDLAWVHGGSSGLQPGHFKDDMNQVFTSLSLPTSFNNSVQTNNWLLVATGTAGKTNVIKIGGAWTNISGVWTNVGGTFYTNKNNAGWVLPVGDGTTATFNNVITNRPQATNNIYYAMNSLGNLFVDAPYSVLYVTNGMSSPTITVSTNGDLFVYSGGDISFGTTVNNTQLARALTICDIAGHPISITASGNASGVAKLYVPSSTLTFNGGGNNTYDIIGEIVGNSVTFNGHFNLHFDESLGSNTIAGQFEGVGWREVQ